MTKRYCDKCNREMDESNTPKGGQNLGRIEATLKHGTSQLKAEVLTTWKGTANAGDICKYCVLDALYELDDRPNQLNHPPNESDDMKRYFIRYEVFTGCSYSFSAIMKINFNKMTLGQVENILKKQHKTAVYISILTINPV